MRSRLPLALFHACCGLMLSLGCATASRANQAGADQTTTRDAPGASEAEPQPPQPAASEPAAVAIPNARSPLPGVVTGGQPSDQNLRDAKAEGYRSVVSLLPPPQSDQEASVARELGLRFVSIPIAGADDLTEENARRLGEVLRDEANRPLILHCASGNRAGALLALEAFFVEGKSAEEALALGERAGLTKLRDAVEQRLK